MAQTDTRALKLARALSEHEIPDRTPMHAALIEARLAAEARLIARVAQLAGVSLDELLAREAEAQGTAAAAIEKTRAAEPA